MTRQEFIDSCEDWWDLKDACSENNSYVCDDIYSDDEFDDFINNELYDMARNNSWTEVRDWLQGIPEGYDWYEVYEGDYYGVSDDGETFDRYKEDFIAWMDDHGNWDDDDDDEDLEEDEEENIEEDDEELEEIDYSEFFDENFESTRGSYIRVKVEISEPEPQNTAEPEPEPEPEVFKDISELFEI